MQLRHCVEVQPSLHRLRADRGETHAVEQRQRRRRAAVIDVSRQVVLVAGIVARSSLRVGNDGLVVSKRAAGRGDTAMQGLADQ